MAQMLLHIIIVYHQYHHQMVKDLEMNDMASIITLFLTVLSLILKAPLIIYVPRPLDGLHQPGSLTSAGSLPHLWKDQDPRFLGFLTPLRSDILLDLHPPFMSLVKER